jgi:hypothetical protein
MAGKKPAKRNVSNAKEAKVELPGKAVKVYGYSADSFECAACSKKVGKAIMYEHTDSKLYCSRNCIPKVQTV